MRTRSVEALSRSSNVTGDQLAKEALRLMLLELEMIEGWAKLQAATGARNNESLRAQCVAAANADQRTELGVYAVRVQELRRKMRM
jgi:hypothetical protein